jgi:large subunit ribosomal protein L2
MPIKSFSPTTPTRRFQTYVTREDITKDRPEKSLVEGKKRTGGRDSRGVTSSRFKGGGAKQAYRIIDFKRDKADVEARVASIEYDPNRSVSKWGVS